MSVLTFDWSQITWPGNPLVMPWWAIANVAVIFVLCYWIIVPIIFYTNVSPPTGKADADMVHWLHAHQRVRVL